MKLLSVLLPLLISAPAFSMHNYYEQNCTLNGVGNELNFKKKVYFESEHMFITNEVPGVKAGDSVYLSISSQINKEGHDGSEILIFGEAKQSNLEKEPYDDGCWEGFTESFNVETNIEKINRPLQDYLGLKVGDKVTLDCALEHLEILGKHCD